MSLVKFENSLEMQWISLDMPTMRRVVLINIYRPPQGEHKNACRQIHESIREPNLKDNADIFLLGDFKGDKQRNLTKFEKLIEIILPII